MFFENKRIRLKNNSNTSLDSLTRLRNMYHMSVILPGLNKEK